MTEPLPGKVILLVEDHEMIRQAFRILLEDSGYQVIEAANGSEALAAAEAQRPDLILLDMGLPDMPGLNVTRKLKANPVTRDTPIVAITGRALAGDEAACRAAGCIGYLAKPVETELLLRRVGEFV